MFKFNKIYSKLKKISLICFEYILLDILKGVYLFFVINRFFYFNIMISYV